MDWEISLRRQALAEWRDRQILAIGAQFNACAGDALAAFDAQVPHANLVNTVWDPAGFADARIDALMRDKVPGLVARFVDLAANELRMLGPEFASVADALARTGFLEMPGTDATAPADPSPVTGSVQPDASKPSAWSAASLPGFRQALSAGQWAAETLKGVGVAAEQSLQDRTGLYDRLRTAAVGRIAARWMGSTGDPRPVMQQVIDLIDDVSLEARTRMS